VGPSGEVGRAGAALDVLWDEVSPAPSDDERLGAGRAVAASGAVGRAAAASEAIERAAAADDAAAIEDAGAVEGAGALTVSAAARRRVAVETFDREEASLRRTALRYSLCEDDADEAMQRSLLILLTKAPSDDARELIRWTQTVVKHEALSVKTERERTLAGPAALAIDPADEDWITLLPAEDDGPAEQAERHEAIERSREALQTLKPAELRALTLRAEGYTYAEIGERTGFSSTKVNRCLVEGRERFRRYLVRRDLGARCAELAPAISAFVDDEAEPADVVALREHLRTCAHCRATLRAYRAVPRAAAALAPLLPPLRHPLVGRLHDAYAALATRVGGGSPASESTLGNLAAAGGGRGAGMAALAKVLAVCAGTVGAGAACVATGVLPAPLLASPSHSQPAAKVTHHRPSHRRAEDAETAAPVVGYEPAEEEAPAEVEAEPGPRETAPPEHHGEGQKAKPEQTEEAPRREAVAESPPPSESGATEAVEAAPVVAPVETEASASSSSPPPSSSSSSANSSSSVGSAAGELGP
jgi:RNA polymerase sigma factor (sigma-70 family)